MAINNELVLKKIIQLYDEKFHIPSYQRGYRWTENQVIQLLDDIWEFAQKPPQYSQNSEKPFYCLQPIVVKKHNSNGYWEVIDGQQRLTTICLVIRYFNEMWIGKQKIKIPEISYETRHNSYTFINNIEIQNSEDELDWAINFSKIEDKIIVKSLDFNIKENIDFYHIANAYKAIHYWVKKQGREFDNNKLQSVFQSETKVIWYETEETESNRSVDVFTRLNIGKIPLTNSELIKALFLMKKNFSQEKASLKQIQIATEWDFIERTLQNNDFWYFIYNPESDGAKDYETRIEYIFDLMKGRRKQSPYYYTFFEFHDDFEQANYDIDLLWLKVKKYFLTFEEWFNDFELYHLIGYLVECNDNTDNLATLQRESVQMSKSEFRNSLYNKIRKQVFDKETSLEDLNYDNNKTRIRKILLLFNIETILQSKKQDMRFPFYKYKIGKWDIEHVDSLTEQTIQGEEKRREWLKDVNEYFAKNPNDSFNRRIEALNKYPKLSDDVFNPMFEELRRYFEDGISEKNNISNLALLDSETNRSYKNSFFPLKRHRIVLNDQKGIFVPIATKNLFLKYYSKFPSKLDFWTQDDANDYFEAIATTLKEYLKKEE